MSKSLKNQERLMQVLLAPVQSEKSTDVADKHNQFVFKVLLGANKQEIKNAVEQLFNVEVASVRTVLRKGKSKNAGRIPGRRGDTKRAYVALKPGHDINFTTF